MQIIVRAILGTYNLRKATRTIYPQCTYLARKIHQLAILKANSSRGFIQIRTVLNFVQNFKGI